MFDDVATPPSLNNNIFLLRYGASTGIVESNSLLHYTSTYVYFNMIEQTYLSSSINVIICIMHDIHSFIGTVRYEGFEISDVQFCKMKLDINKMILECFKYQKFSCFRTVQYDIRYIHTYVRTVGIGLKSDERTQIHTYVNTFAPCWRNQIDVTKAPNTYVQ